MLDRSDGGVVASKEIDDLNAYGTVMFGQAVASRCVPDLKGIGAGHADVNELQCNCKHLKHESGEKQKLGREMLEAVLLLSDFHSFHPLTVLFVEIVPFEDCKVPICFFEESSNQVLAYYAWR